jgi:hypothetical protein
MFAFGAGKRLGHYFADQDLTGLAGMNVAGELVRQGKRSIQQAEGACVSAASRRLKGAEHVGNNCALLRGSCRQRLVE